jgi:hypothetical protein
MSTHWSQNGRRYPPPKQPLIPLFSSRVYKYAKYLLSSPFRHSKADHLHPNSFFSRLPYDIRAIIYVYLEDDKNLLALSRYDSIGFMLSCRKAKEELNEDASRRLRYFLDEFARNTSLELKVQQCKCDPQVVTVLILMLDGSAKFLSDCIHYYRNISTPYEFILFAPKTAHHLTLPKSKRAS